ncbi:hypothetical protein EX30DRAFT_307582 [Ascodesmis nigricans]|uniref:FHA domain-containing protein n=1 Tax=Ascodesmis nigricans TaxID=341454 RepID=A0A4V3SIL3_9PEZI|nr:hypothetical protein EX30DRAFT_307582 [Ascodesmis nigricans]
MPRKRSSKSADFYRQRQDIVNAALVVSTKCAPSMQNSIKKEKASWSEYCEMMGYDPDTELSEFRPQTIKGYLDWFVNEGSIKKLSTVRTKWKYLRLVYKDFKRELVDMSTSLEIKGYIETVLTSLHPLSLESTNRPVMDVSDMYALLHYLWALDTHVYPHERYRIQLHLAILLMAYTSSRPGAIVESSCYAGSNEGLTYRDFKLTLFPNPRPDEGDLITLEVTLRHLKGKRSIGEKKIYVMHERDDNPVFCPVLPFISLALADNAFKAQEVNADNVFNLGVPRDRRNSIQFEWKPSHLDIPVLRRTEATASGVGISPTMILPYSTLNDQFQQLEMLAGFRKALTMYTIRRGAGNAVNGIANSAERNQAMGHSRSEIFERHYISQTVKIDVQSAFLGSAPREELIQAVGRLSRDRDVWAPTKLTTTQKDSISNDPAVIYLKEQRDDLSVELRKTFGTITNGKRARSLIYDRYWQVTKSLAKEIGHLRYAKLQEVRDSFFDCINTAEIDIQLHDKKDVSLPSKGRDVVHELQDRNILTKLLFQSIPIEDGTDKRRRLRSDVARSFQTLCSSCEVQFSNRRSTHGVLVLRIARAKLSVY